MSIVKQGMEDELMASVSDNKSDVFGFGKVDSCNNIVRGGDVDGIVNVVT